MKYIKLFETYKTIDEIKNWLDKYGIKNYTINDDLTVDVDGDVYLSHNQLTSILVQFKNVGGYFYCYNNQLTSLEGCPSSVGGDFYCSNNQLTSLKGAPSIAGGDFYCSNNQLTSLEGCPSSVSGDFYCYSNKLTSLKGSPVDCMSKGNFYNIYNNKFSWDQEKLDEYWEKQIENDPLVFKNLKLNNREKANKSNQISQELYNKYTYLDRGNKAGLLDINKR
jgi:hypothetical protein